MLSGRRAGTEALQNAAEVVRAAEALAGRLTVHDVAEAHDVTPGAVRAWIRDARRTARAT